MDVGPDEYSSYVATVAFQTLLTITGLAVTESSRNCEPRCCHRGTGKRRLRDLYRDTSHELSGWESFVILNVNIRYDAV